MIPHLPYCDLKKKNRIIRKVGYKTYDMDEEGGVLNKRKKKNCYCKKTKALDKEGWKVLVGKGLRGD